MSKKIQNLTGRQVIIRLSSGQSLFIGPGGVSNEIPDKELRDNTMVNKLQAKRVIRVLPVEAKVADISAQAHTGEAKSGAGSSSAVEEETGTIEKNKKKTKTKGGK
ncbi:MAG: hypothetical protein KAW12_08170 [Candidatus Aminicenantes bacterium]|nr:hypothetical protein [Candidatus Aminicenantes bacterium]